MIYLDWAATALPEEDIILSCCKRACAFFANPSSKHFKGKEASEVLEGARKDVALALEVKPETVFFTSGGTESDHIPLLAYMALSSPCSLAISSLEHSAVAEQAKILKRRGYEILNIPADRHGIIRPEAVLKTLREDTSFAAVMAVNNELGSIQPIAEIRDALEEYSKGKRKIHFHTDAVQAMGKIPFKLSNLKIHSAAFSGHKIGAMRGCGILYLTKNMEPFIRGGGHERGIRPGTENISGILSLAECLKLYTSKEKEFFDHAVSLMKFLIKELQALKGIRILPEARIKAPEAYSPWILQFSCEDYPGEVLVRILSEKGICISTGSACSSKKNNRPVLEAIGLDIKTRLNAVRVSIGYSTSIEEITGLISALKEILYFS